MKRILTILLSVLISTTAFGQNEFDKKVEQLFFNKHVYDNSMSLIDTLAAVKSLNYVPPKAADGNLTTIGVVDVRTHVFEFKPSSSIPVIFDKGAIILQVQEKGKQKLLKDITWQLEFENKEAAFLAFTELEKYFSIAGTKHKVYKNGVSLSTAEFSNNSSSQYPHIMFVLLDNKNPEKKYKIRLFLE